MCRNPIAPPPSPAPKTQPPALPEKRNRGARYPIANRIVGNVTTKKDAKFAQGKLALGPLYGRHRPRPCGGKQINLSRLNVMIYIVFSSTKPSCTRRCIVSLGRPDVGRVDLRGALFSRARMQPAVPRLRTLNLRPDRSSFWLLAAALSQ